MINKHFTGIALLIFLLTAVSTFAATGEKVSTLEDQKEVAVTIYNENLALVKDKRTLTLPEGESTLAFREVSGRMRPETALLQSVSGKQDLEVIEQNFDFFAHFAHTFQVTATFSLTRLWRRLNILFRYVCHLTDFVND